MTIHRVLGDVTERIRRRSAAARAAYLGRLDAARAKGPVRSALGCTNLAHAFAAAPAGDKLMLREIRRPQERDLAPVHAREVGNRVVVGRDDDAIEHVRACRGLQRVPDQRLPSQALEILPRNPFRAAASGDDT